MKLELVLTTLQSMPEWPGLKHLLHMCGNLHGNLHELLWLNLLHVAVVVVVVDSGAVVEMGWAEDVVAVVRGGA